MNRVRVVAVTAVVLGVAVVAGTKFQESQEIAALGAQNAAVAPAVQSLIQSAALVPTEMPGEMPSEMSSEMPTEMSAVTSVVSPDGLPEVEAVARIPVDRLERLVPDAPQVPTLSTASILPTVDLSAADGDGKPDELRASEAALIDNLLTDPTAPVAPAFAPLRTADAEDALPVAPIDEEMSAELAACAVWLVVTPAPGALLDASVYAPCDRDARVQVSHAGLTFDTQIGADGQLMLMVPALVDDATLNVTFADGRVQSDTTFVPDLIDIERVALQWTGPATLLLHAYEFGAQYGENGHVHAGNPLAPGIEGQGFLTVLGDPVLDNAQMVQVYSFPIGQSSRTGSVTLEIEVPVTDASCGRPLIADSIEMRGNAAARRREIQLEMPACDGTGGFVVLPGVLPDLQIAALR